MIGVCGEALIDLAPDPDGRYVARPGGAPVNVAVALARLGRDVTFLGALAGDGFGDRLRAHLGHAGVALDRVVASDAPTTVAVVHLDAAGRATYRFYLDGTTAQAGLPESALAGLGVLHLSCGAVTLGAGPLGAVLQSLLEAPAGRLLSFDPNVRPLVIEDRAAYAARVDRAVAGAAIVKVSDDDLRWLHPGSDPREVGREWARCGPRLVVVTRGPAGATAFAGDTMVSTPAAPVDVVDTVGAGDAFTAGLLSALDADGALSHDRLDDLDDGRVRAALAMATRIGALTCTRAGADPPGLEEL